jgi:hypothetical protein
MANAKSLILGVSITSETFRVVTSAFGSSERLASAQIFASSQTARINTHWPGQIRILRARHGNWAFAHRTSTRPNFISLNIRVLSVNCFLRWIAPFVRSSLLLNQLPRHLRYVALVVTLLYSTEVLSVFVLRFLKLMRIFVSSSVATVFPLPQILW